MLRPNRSPLQSDVGQAGGAGSDNAIDVGGQLPDRIWKYSEKDVRACGACPRTSICEVTGKNARITSET